MSLSRPQRDKNEKCIVFNPINNIMRGIRLLLQGEVISGGNLIFCMNILLKRVDFGELLTCIRYIEIFIFMLSTAVFATTEVF